MDAFFSFLQISSLLKLIELDLPDITVWFIEQMSLFTTINLNIPFLKPLQYCNSSFVDEDGKRYISYGFEKYNMLYSIQTDIIVFSLIILSIYIAFKIKNRLEGTVHKIGLKVYDYCINMFNERRATVAEMYYQERLYLYLCIFHMLKRGQINALDIVGLVFAVTIIIVDCKIIWRLAKKILYARKTVQIALTTNFIAGYENTYTIIIQLCLLGNQILLPLVLVFFSASNYMQSMTVSMLLLLMLILIMKARLVDRKTRVNYMINYSALFGYCIITSTLSFMGDVTKENVSGWILNMCYIIPIVASITIYFMSLIPLLKEKFKNCCERCRRRKNIRRVINVQ